MGKELEKIDHTLTPPSSISRMTLTARGLLTWVEVLIEVKEKAGNDLEGNWTEHAMERSNTAGDDGGENKRKTL
jgi:hypothetical protein